MIHTIDDIFTLFETHGQHRYGEDVTQLAHALQVAELAREAGGNDGFVAAALLHDLGQLIDDAGEAAEKQGRDARHEEHGADILTPLFPDAVTSPIRLHVAAKRYLCAVEPAYAEHLSAASRLSLSYQGGAMSPEEVAQFEALPFWREAVLLRRFDDTGKATARAPAPLESYRAVLERAARAPSSGLSQQSHG